MFLKLYFFIFLMLGIVSLLSSPLLVEGKIKKPAQVIAAYGWYVLSALLMIAASVIYQEVEGDNKYLSTFLLSFQ